MYEDHIAPGAPRRVDLLIHHGDQVYADKAFNAGKKLLLNKSDTRAKAEKYKEIVHEYQQFYRRTWARPETRRVLANVSVRRSAAKGGLLRNPAMHASSYRTAGHELHPGAPPPPPPVHRT